MNTNAPQIDQSLLDLLFYDKPDFSTSAILTIEAMAPLSMVSSLPGSYFRSQPYPTEMMMLGLFENALGLHLVDELREELRKKHKFQWRRSRSRFQSILQNHIRFSGSRILPAVMHYDDLWAQHLRNAAFISGSRTYDWRVIPALNADRQKDISIAERAGYSKESKKVTEFEEGDEIHINPFREFFPQYYPSPTPREYVVWDGPFKVRFETGDALLSALMNACCEPVGPLFLGSNDGWVDASITPVSK